MRTRHALTLAVVALATAAGPLASTASAGPPETVTGTIDQLAPVTYLSSDVTGKAHHLVLADFSMLTGALFTPAGAEPVRTEYRCVVVEGKTTFHCRGRGSGTATVTGVGTGEVVATSILTCTAGSSGAVLCDGRLRVDGVGGDVAGVHATGTFSNTGVPGRVRYDLRLHRH